jgi:hypothetical protein
LKWGDKLLENDPKLVFLFILSIMFLIYMPVVAVVLPPEVDEIQNLQIVTSVDGVGSISYYEDLSCSLSSEILGANGYRELVMDPEPHWEWVFEPEPPLNEVREVQSHVTYSEDTQANLGIISYRKTSELDTEALAGAQYNVWNERLITFTGIDAGTLLSSEDMTMFNVGNCTFPVFCTCPFCTGGCMRNPAFCSRIETGSDLDMSKVAAYLAGGFRNVNEEGDSTVWPPVPSVEGAALAKYTVQVTEMGEGEASAGSVSTYLKISESDGDFDCLDPQAIDPNLERVHLEVEEYQSFKGDINLFDYQLNFKSQICGDSGNC